jgi:glycosyltransferase involved in cell wall biosynthesis/GT2 family glycosyltransferase
MIELVAAKLLFGRPLRAGDCLAVLTLYSGGDTWRSCVESLLEHTSAEMPIVVFDDAGPSSLALAQLQQSELAFGREFYYFRQASNQGVVKNLNSAFEMLAPADIIVLNSDIIVGPEWDVRLVEAGRCRTDVATATAFSTSGDLFGVVEPFSWAGRIPSTDQLAEASVKVASASRKIRPFVPTATSFCTYFSRRALNVVGVLDKEFSPGYGEEVDFSLRCLSFGFSHVVADDVLVFHATGESFGAVQRNNRKRDNDELVSRRHPYWHEWTGAFQAQADTPLELTRHLASAAVNGIRIAIDAEKIHPNLTGTFEGSIAIVRAIARQPQVNEVVLVALSDSVNRLRNVVESMGIPRTIVVAIDEIASVGFFDIAFRPYQDYSGGAWPTIASHAHRNIVWVLDLIAARNPFYAKDFQAYEVVRDSFAGSIFSADAIGALTPHVVSDLASFESNSGVSGRVFLLPNGPVDNAGREDRALEIVRPEFDDLAPMGYILLLGTSFLHKNITWFIRTFLLLKDRGWAGDLVIAGPTPTTGYSDELDADIVELSGTISVRRVGSVSHLDKLRLIDGAALVVTPSVTEGWGLVPAEAAARGVVPLASRGGGLDDISPQSALALGLEDDALDAETIYMLLTDEDARATQLAAWLEVGDLISWDHSARVLVEHAYLTFSAPRRMVRVQEHHANVGQRRPWWKRAIVSGSVVFFPRGSRRRARLSMAVRSIRATGRSGS